MDRVTEPIDGPHLKDEDHYLTNPVWVGNTVPGRYLGYPWGLGGECWWVRAYVLDPDSELSWARRRVFAGMDPDAVVAAAQAWLHAGAPIWPSPLEANRGAVPSPSPRP